MPFVFSNHAETQLAAPLLAGDLEATVATGDASLFRALNAGEIERLVITDGVSLEIVDVTAWAGDVATITRAVEGGSAQAWATGSIVSSRVTAGLLASMLQRSEYTPATPATNTGGGGGGFSPIANSVVQIPNGATAFDAATAFPDLSLLPEFFLVDWSRTAAIAFTLPDLSTLSTGQIVKTGVICNGSNPIHTFNLDILVPNGHYMNNTLNGTDYISYSRKMFFRGYKALDGSMRWIN